MKLLLHQALRPQSNVQEAAQKTFLLVDLSTEARESTEQVNVLIVQDDLDQLQPAVAQDPGEVTQDTTQDPDEAIQDVTRDLTRIARAMNVASAITEHVRILSSRESLESLVSTR